MLGRNRWKGVGFEEFSTYQPINLLFITTYAISRKTTNYHSLSNREEHIILWRLRKPDIQMIASVILEKIMSYYHILEAYGLLLVLIQGFKTKSKLLHCLVYV